MTSAITMGRFRLSASAPRTFSKMDLVRTRRRLGLASVPVQWETLVSQLGHGAIGGADEWARIGSPDEVVAWTERLRARGLPAGSAWADAALLPSTLVGVTFSFGDALAWIGARERWVRVPVDPANRAVDLGADLFDALDMALHLMGAPAELDVEARD